MLYNLDYRLQVETDKDLDPDWVSMVFGSMLMSAFSSIWGSRELMNDNIKDWKLAGKHAESVKEEK
jgi:hypothetical protein